MAGKVARAPLYGGYGRSVVRTPGQPERDTGDDDVQDHGNSSRDRHIVYAEQVEAREQAAEYGTGDIAAVEVAQPRDAVRRRAHPARDGRERCAHQQRRWDEANGGY